MFTEVLIQVNTQDHSELPVPLPSACMATAVVCMALQAVVPWILVVCSISNNIITRK